jgi:hypothetical protein
VRKPEGKDHLEDLSMDRKIIAYQILTREGCEGVKWIHLGQDRVQNGGFL